MKHAALLKTDIVIFLRLASVTSPRYRTPTVAYPKALPGAGPISHPGKPVNGCRIRKTPDGTEDGGFASRLPPAKMRTIALFLNIE
jgi:hypothetical protein